MKRFAAILLAGMFCFSAALPAFAAVQTNASAWAVSSMEYAYEQKLVTEAELQKATSPMSRKEFCGVTMRFLQAVTGEEKTVTKESPFSDCDDPMVIAAYEAGIIGGIKPGVFAPNQTLTREQMAIMVARTLKVCAVDLSAAAKKNPFSDTKELYDASNTYIDQLYGAGIVSGYQDGTFGPFRKMTVQEAVASFVRAHQYSQTGSIDASTEEPSDEAENPPVAVPDDSNMELVVMDGKKIALGMTTAELKAYWGEPDRIDKTVYSLNRYVYLNDYQQYFYVTIEGNKVVELFIPGASYQYLGMNGTGTIADIKNLDYVSAAEHSGIIQGETAEARLPLDFEGKISGLELQTTAFAEKKDPVSTLHLEVAKDIEAELLDLIQVKRAAANVPLLTEDSRLTAVARAHSTDMAKKDYFAYNSPDGTTPFGRIMERKKDFTTASETIAKQRGDVVNLYQELVRSAAKLNALTDKTMREGGVGVASKSKVLHVTVDLCG